MQIFYLGGPTLIIKHETHTSSEGEITVLINPHGDIPGLPKLRKQKADIVLATYAESFYHDPKLYDDGFLIDSPGEYEVKDVLVGATEISGKTLATIFRLDIENVSLGYLGGVDVNHDTSQIIQALEGVDVLVAPVGGNGVLSSGDALKLVSSIEPRIVIPIQYKTKTFSVKRDTIDSFLKEFGAPDTEIQTKIKIQRKDLPADERRLAVLA